MNFILWAKSFISNFFLDISSLIKVVILSKKTNFNNINFDNKEILILGNGPSLINTINKKGDFLINKTLLCVNHFAETELYENLKPTIYVLGAPEMWRDDVEDFYLEKGKNLFDKITERTNWKLNLFIPFCAKSYSDWQDKILKNKNINICFFNNTPAEGSRYFTHLLFKYNLAMPRPHNVLIPSIMISLNLGFKYIYIAGADHTWMKDVYVSENNQVFLTQKHFYDYNEAKGKTMDNRGIGERKMYEILEKWMFAFKGYFIIKDYAKIIPQSRIINITPDSFIDAFERQKI